MENQKITIEVIETKQFRVAAKGYDQLEVDEFLDSICDEFERMENEVAAMQQKLDMAQAQARKAEAEAGAVKPAEAAPAPATTPDGTFREILEMAQKVKEQTIADAEAKAADIIANAQEEAKARLGNLAEEKENLEKVVETLKASAKEYKEKFAALIELAKEGLDAAGDL
ncbi:MAG: DivIVA domain-containing protein [Clostridia bacterium]|nr:DivIVA domain-containing protein [Clostridia bacterium]